MYLKNYSMEIIHDQHIELGFKLVDSTDFNVADDELYVMVKFNVT